MAKRGRPAAQAGAPESIGSALGSVMAKVDAWMAQRGEIARELRQAADKIMAGENPFGQRATTPSMLAKEVARRGRPPRSSAAKAARPAGSADALAPAAATGRRKMSAAARKRISDAQKARWAKLRRSSK